MPLFLHGIHLANKQPHTNQRRYAITEGIADRIVPARSNVQGVQAMIARRQAAANRRALATTLLGSQIGSEQCRLVKHLFEDGHRMGLQVYALRKKVRALTPRQG